MSTCKDCIHYEACKSIWEALGYVVDGDGEAADERCIEFEDKSLYIKLPCKVGDRIFRIVTPAGVADKPFVPLVGDKVESFGIYYRNLIWDYSYITFDEIGKTVFLTREEAEAALKEREK